MTREKILELEKAMNKLDDCIGDCSQETYDAIKEVYSLIDELKLKNLSWSENYDFKNPKLP